MQALLRLSPPLPVLQLLCSGKMSKGPGLYCDIAKKARELLYKDYQTEHKFGIITRSPTGVAITSSGLKNGELLLAEVTTQLMKNNMTADVKVDTESNAEIQYLLDHAGICSRVGLTVNPLISFSAVVGSPALVFGTDLSFDPKTGDFPKCNFGVGYSNTDLIASLTLNDTGDTISASCYHLMNLVTNTAVGSEITRSFSSSANTLTVGAQTSLDPLTVLKTQYWQNQGGFAARVEAEVIFPSRGRLTPGPSTGELRSVWPSHSTHDDEIDLFLGRNKKILQWSENL